MSSRAQRKSVSAFNGPEFPRSGPLCVRAQCDHAAMFTLAVILIILAFLAAPRLTVLVLVALNAFGAMDLMHHLSRLLV